MSHRKYVLPFLGILLAVCPVAQAQESVDNSGGSDGSAFTAGEQDSSHWALREGNWIWGLLTESMLSGGTTYALADATAQSTYYVGGPGFVAVTHDSGANWTEALTFQHTDTGLDDDEDEEIEIQDSDRPKMAERRREVIRQEIVDKFGSEDYADSILDNISDTELLEARDLSDIDDLEVLELDMDSDLTHIRLDGDAESGTNSYLSEFDTYIERYTSLVQRGAESETASGMAANSAAVWQIVSTPSASFAVTSDAIFMTTDQGDTWQTFTPCSEDRACLSMAISQDAQIVVIGTTKGLRITRNGGNTWETAMDGIEDGFFNVRILDGGTRIATLSPNSLYDSKDRGQSWNVIPFPIPQNEIIIDVEYGSGNRMLVLTNEALYRADSGGWDLVDTPFGEEEMREIVTKDDSLTSFVVRTDAHVYEYAKGAWLSQNEALFATDLNGFNYLHDNYSLGIMTSPAGVWIGQDMSVIENSPEYQQLKEKWAREPSDEMVLEKAIEAHYLGEILETRWGMRSCLAWLLPRVDFDYMIRQDRWDYRKTVTNTGSGIEESDVWTSKRQTRHEWQIMAHWDFQIDKANTDSVAREATLAGLRDDRLALVKRVNKELKKRHALEMTLLLDLPKLPDNARASQKMGLVKKQVRAELSLREAESHLNYLTGGYYLPAIYGNRQP